MAPSQPEQSARQLASTPDFIRNPLFPSTYAFSPTPLITAAAEIKVWQRRVFGEVETDLVSRRQLPIHFVFFFFLLTGRDASERHL